MLDHDQRVPGIAQLHQDLEQFLDVGEMQSGRRLVENVNRPPGRALCQLGRELHPLRFPTG